MGESLAKKKETAQLKRSCKINKRGKNACERKKRQMSSCLRTPTSFFPSPPPPPPPPQNLISIEDKNKREILKRRVGLLAQHLVGVPQEDPQKAVQMRVLGGLGVPKKTLSLLSLVLPHRGGKGSNNWESPFLQTQSVLSLLP